MSTEHPERERLAEVILHGMGIGDDDHWPEAFQTADAILALPRPEAVSPRDSASDKKVPVSVIPADTAASPPEGREPEPRDMRRALEMLEHYEREGRQAESGIAEVNWFDATFAAQTIRGLWLLVKVARQQRDSLDALRAPAAPVDRGLVERLLGEANAIESARREDGFAEPSTFVTRLLREAAAALEGRDADAEPTEREINEACMNYRHDFGLLDTSEWSRVRSEAREWLRAWSKVEVRAALERAPESRAGEVTNG